MFTIKNRIQEGNKLLAPYAVPIQGLKGRIFPEIEDETRFTFQRDRDRIIHTQAFRRLKGKTQVFVTGQGDHYRTRLTHTMEVSQISRDMARTLSLQEDLTECIALAHDLGHPPFGHAGEEAINEWISKFGLSFEHNVQSHRIVTLLEEHCNQYKGLNLNKEILDGLLKHQTSHDQKDAIFHGHTLEAQIVNIADEIAYSAHDSDDGINVKLFSLKDLTDVPLADKAYKMTLKRGTSIRGALIDLLVTDIYSASILKLKEKGIETLQDVLNTETSLIGFSEEMTNELGNLRKFLWNNMYLHEKVLSKSDEGKSSLLSLLAYLYENPNAKILSIKEKTNGTLEEAVKDYVAGMTERYAEEMKQYNNITI